MENSTEYPTQERRDEDRHFEIRQKIQAEIISDYFGLKNARDVNNEQADGWIRSNAADFGKAFATVVEEHPSFWHDVEHDFAGAVNLVEQKMTAQKIKPHN